jgi:hypothetical protein
MKRPVALGAALAVAATFAALATARQTSPGNAVPQSPGIVPGTYGSSATGLTQAIVPRVQLRMNAKPHGT